ncbi:MAG: hypothetical protein ACRD2P_03160, partial [Terriglobia bacterium]
MWLIRLTRRIGRIGTGAFLEPQQQPDLGVNLPVKLLKLMRDGLPRLIQGIESPGLFRALNLKLRLPPVERLFLHQRGALLFDPRQQLLNARVVRLGPLFVTLVPQAEELAPARRIRRAPPDELGQRVDVVSAPALRLIAPLAL